MGALTSRQNAGVEEIDIPSSSVYRYPPKSGSYFASHFIMGGEKFDSAHPEGYLFGENTDLNFLGNRPLVFPYNAPPPHEPVKTLRSLINIRKDTLRLVRCNEDMKLPGQEVGKSHSCYNIEFTFDADTQVTITIYYQAIEEFHNGVYLPQDSSLQSETVHFKRGVCQQFCLPSHYVNLSEWADEELSFDMDKDIYPMVVQAVVDEGDEHLGHSHVLLATFEKHMDGSYCVKPLKQKQVVDGVSYLLQEIYGIENKYNSQESKVAEDEISDNSAECVVCLSDVRDTLILPCRHLCLCNACADTLRYQANCCPICRLPFRALLQIRAMRKKLSPLTPTGFNPVITSHTSDSEEHSVTKCSYRALYRTNIFKSSFTFVCLPVHFLSCSDPVSSSLAQSVMSMASSHSQHSQISTDTLSSMSGSYMAGAEGDEATETPAESRAPSQHEGEVRQLEGLEAEQFVTFVVFIFRCFSSC
uniref:E3 ubiquitin-protein ligase n=1 Tax=Cyprinus carpio TaxID=7962 RepID=A0A8C2AKV8_CYPCA